MNQGIKHLIIFLFNLALLFATLFVPRQVDNKEQMKNVRLGYPVAFVSQDFSYYNKYFSFFPNWQKFNPQNKNCPYKIIPVNLIISMATVFALLEFFICIIEIIHIKIFFREVN
ncbi:MAG TPA: hypothetical protein PLK35_00565 [Candidatus Moranbacteria bacterium]|nr:hypothetical protein [Candidatus Moranbacteria bacterium]